jgi:hypothetical protein
VTRPNEIIRRSVKVIDCAKCVFRPRGIGKYRQLVSPIVERLTGSSSDLEVLIVFRDGSPLEEPCDEENA